mmetsp:Transcript_35278/g.52435  ORF Transcript_35278/g.52435 Transcript_35278/m.52435 type:complete len:80 (-) Transcript_35278:238-477(-)
MSESKPWSQLGNTARCLVGARIVRSGFFWQPCQQQSLLAVVFLLLALKCSFVLAVLGSGLEWSAKQVTLPIPFYDSLND